MSAPHLTAKEKGVVKKKEDPLKEALRDFKKDKPIFSGGSARRMLGLKVNLPKSAQFWVQRWLTQKVQENCWPPQMAQKDGWGAIQQFLPPEVARRLVEEMRVDFRRDHPMLCQPYEESQSSDDQIDTRSLASRYTQALSLTHSLPSVALSQNTSQTADENPQELLEE
jgi:hypothetical protein